MPENVGLRRFTRTLRDDREQIDGCEAGDAMAWMGYLPGVRGTEVQTAKGLSETKQGGDNSPHSNHEYGSVFFDGAPFPWFWETERKTTTSGGSPKNHTHMGIFSGIWAAFNLGKGRLARSRRSG